MSLLQGDSMVAGYGKTRILDHCSIAVDRGEIAVIVGPNGAGKSTAMKALFGMLPLTEGSVTLDGEEISSLSPIFTTPSIRFIPCFPSWPKNDASRPANSPAGNASKSRLAAR